MKVREIHNLFIKDKDVAYALWKIADEHEKHNKDIKVTIRNAENKKITDMMIKCYGVNRFAEILFEALCRHEETIKENRLKGKSFAFINEKGIQIEDPIDFCYTSEIGEYKGAGFDFDNVKELIFTVGVDSSDYSAAYNFFCRTRSGQALRMTAIIATINGVILTAYNYLVSIADSEV